MAVEAQYPSNILFLNRNAQEGHHDYSFQPQQGSYIDQSHLPFNNGAAGNSNTNQRKRGREASATTEITPSMIPFSLQHSQPPPPPSQLIDLSQLHNRNQNYDNNQRRHPNVVSTGLRLSFGDQQQQQQLQQQHQKQESNSSSSSSLFSVLSDDFASQMKQQRDELDHFLQAQGKQLQRTLAEKRQRHYRALLCAAEESISLKLREKEAEFQKASRRNIELETRAARLAVEAQKWQAKARAQETEVALLKMQVQQAKAMLSASFHVALGAQDSRRVDDGLTCAENQAEDAESRYIDPERATELGPSCKACRKRAVSVVLLPCRHLCLCVECDQMVQSCPLCLCLRNSSVEVFPC